MVYSQMTAPRQQTPFNDLSYLNTVRETDAIIEMPGGFAGVRGTKFCSEATVTSLEAFRQHLLGSRDAAGGSRVILFNSTSEHKRSEACLCKFARLLSTTGSGRVVSIDCDFAGHELHSYFDSKRGKGLTEYVSDSASLAEVVRETNVDDVFLIGSGLPQFSSLKLFMSSKFLNLVDALRNEFDYILLNAPPYRTGVEAFVLAKFLRPTILLLPDSTNKHDDAADVYDELSVLRLDVLVHKTP